jgi:hypothetical protein
MTRLLGNLSAGPVRNGLGVATSNELVSGVGLQRPPSANGNGDVAVVVEDNSGVTHMWDGSGNYIGAALSNSGGGSSDFVNVSLNGGNPAQTANGEQLIQFNIVNGAAGDVVLRIGSLVGQAGVAAQYGLSAGAADNALVTATVGTAVGIANVGPVQVFSRLTVAKPMSIVRMRIISTNTAQLAAAVNISELSQAFLTGQVTGTQPYSAGATFNMDDTRTNMTDYVFSNLIIEAERWIEITSVAGASMQVILGIIAKHNVAQLMPMGN